MPLQSQQEGRDPSGNENERAQSEVSEVVFHDDVRRLDRRRWVIVTHIPRAAFLRYFLCSTMSPFSDEIAASTSAFSFSGTLNLSSVATR